MFEIFVIKIYQTIYKTSRYKSNPMMMLGRMPTEDKAHVLTENVPREMDLKPIGPKALIPPYSEVRSSTTKTYLT